MGRVSSGEWSLIASLAIRNFWRQRRRNLSLLIAVAIGMAATLAGGFLIRGWQLSSVEETVEQFGGAVLIHHPKWVDDPKPAYSINMNADVVKQLNSSGARWIDRIVAGVTLRSERETRGAVLLGIDVERERELTSVSRLRIDGDFLAEDTTGIVIGAALAIDLETRIGKRLVLLANDSANKPVEYGLRIVGIYHGTSEAAERGTVYVTKSTAARLLDMHSQTSEIALSTTDPLATTERVEQLQALLTEQELTVRDWQTVAPGVWAMYKLVEGMVLIWQMIFLAALAFGLINTLVAAVLERTREFGLLMAVGMRPGSILKQVLVESWLILFSGLLLGALVAAFIYLWLSSGIDVSQYTGGLQMVGMNRPLYPVVFPGDIITLTLIVVTFGFFASLYPARRAVALDPIAALNKH